MTRCARLREGKRHRPRLQLPVPAAVARVLGADRAGDDQHLFPAQPSNAAAVLQPRARHP